MLTVITGPPCGGKSTYAQQHARPGDIVIDFDLIAQALGSPVSHGHDDAIWRVTLAARNAAIAQAIEWHRRGTRVWVVDTAPPEARMAQYAKAGAKMVRLTADPAELHRRADAARPPSWHARIDQWLAADGQAAPPLDHRPHARTVTNPAPQPRTEW